MPRERDAPGGTKNHRRTHYSTSLEAGKGARKRRDIAQPEENRHWSVDVSPCVGGLLMKGQELG
jgi:hypothetical protein